MAKALQQVGRICDARIASAASIIILLVAVAVAPALQATTGWDQIVTPDLQPEGELSLTLQLEDRKLGNPYELQAEMGLTKWAEVAVFRGLDPDEWIFGTEIGLRTEEPWLLSIGFVNWSPHRNVDPEPFIVAGYYKDPHKIIAGVSHVDYRHEALLGYAYSFNDCLQVQVDWQSGSGNASTLGFTWNVTPRLSITPAVFVTNDSPHEVLGFITFSYTFCLWGCKKDDAPRKCTGHVAGVK